MKKNAIIFLSKFPHEDTIRFANEIMVKTDFEVVIISDQPCFLKPVLHLTDQLCLDNGYYNSHPPETHIKKNPIAWDKAMLFLCEIFPCFEYVWIFEDDCFIPSINTILNLHEKYSNFDFVSANNKLNNSTKPQDWHWRSIYNKINPPYYYSMVCGCGMSNKLLEEIKKYVKANKTLFYIEVMFNTLAMQANLKVTDAKELKSIVWMGDWDIDEFLLLPNNIFHPLKDIGNHKNLRNELQLAIEEKYIPFNRLPEFLL